MHKLKGIWRRKVSSLLLLPIAALLMAASGFYVTPSRNRILESATPIEPGTELIVDKGSVFYRQPVGQARVGVIGSDIAIAIADQTATIAKGTVLNSAVSVEGTAAGQIDGMGMVFCSEPKIDSMKQVLSGMTLGLASLGQRVGWNTQFCFVDSDGDGFLDQAFLVGAKKSNDLKPILIAPTPVELVLNKPLPGESEARLRFIGSNWHGRPCFQLDVLESGKRLDYSNGNFCPDPEKLPQEVQLFGSSFTVTAYDRNAKQVHLTWHHGFGTPTYGISTTTSYTYIPIYTR